MKRGKNSSNEGFEVHGEWWVPSEPENRIAGVLVFDPPDPCVLRVVSKNPESDFFQSTQNVELILGDALGGENGGKFTLAYCRKTHWQHDAIGLYSIGVEIGIVYRGQHIYCLKDSNSAGFFLGFKSLVNWIEESVLTVESSFDKFQIQGESRIGNPEEVDDLGSVSIIQTSGVPSYSDREIPFEVYETVRLNCEFSKFQTFEFSYFAIYAFECFFSIANQCWAARNAVSLKMRSSPGGDLDRANNASVRVFQRKRFGMDPVGDQTSYERLFGQKDLDLTIGECLSKWIAVFPKLKATLDLYMVALYSDQHLEGRFMMLIQAIESYHRRFFSGVYMEQSKFDDSIYPKLANSIPVEIEGDHRDSLKNRLKYANEISLRKRLTELLEEHRDTIETIVVVPGDVVNRMVNLRNAQTHSIDGVGSEFSAKDFFVFSDILRLVLDACFLKEMGFAKSTMVKLFDRNQNYRRMFSGVSL
jgi:hypothetical protein